MHKDYYYKFSRFLKEHFGHRVQKITIDAGFTCPNRDGAVSTGGCIYCDNSAFNVNVRRKPQSIEDQIQSGINFGKKRGHSEFMAYFQPFSNTYESVAVLKKRYDTIRQFPEVTALSIGTRPDCVDDEKLALINSYTDDYMVWIEYGLQSTHDKTLSRINRGHDSTTFFNAITATQAYPAIYICVHVILGLPGETTDDILHTAELLASLPIHGVKLHPLHVVRNTALATMFENGEVSLLSFDEYVALACDYMERLPEHFVIQRITADAPPDLLLGPEWVSRKMGIHNAIDNEFRRRGTRQGSHYSK